MEEDCISTAQAHAYQAGDPGQCVRALSTRACKCTRAVGWSSGCRRRMVVQTHFPEDSNSMWIVSTGAPSGGGAPLVVGMGGNGSTSANDGAEAWTPVTMSGKPFCGAKQAPSGRGGGSTTRAMVTSTSPGGSKQSQPRRARAGTVKVQHASQPRVHKHKWCSYR